MHEALKEIPNRILDVAIGALTQANQHAVYYDPGMDHWKHMSVLNAALAGELFLKAIIAKEHPLLIFRDLFHLDDSGSQELDLDRIIERGRTYNFEHLPKLLWVATGQRIPDADNFERMRRVRNSIQHFCVPADVHLKRLVLEFIYKNLDPLIYRNFGLCAVEYHEDDLLGYDYVVSCVIANELLFSVPNNFRVTEIDLHRELSKRSAAYQAEMGERFSRVVTA